MSGDKKQLEKELDREAKLNPSPHVAVNIAGDYIPSKSESVIKSLNNYIILGGATQNTVEGLSKPAYSSTITLVSGLGTSVKTKPPTGKYLTLSNKFYYDSAVIQISEQTDVDRNFGSRNTNDLNAKKSSAIALKADEIRLFSRGSVKIVTGIDQMEKDQISKDPDAASQPNREFSGISLVANNAAETDGELHPLVLGRNLEEFLNKVLDELNNLYALIFQLFDAQSQINNAVRDHTHLCNFTLKPLEPWTDPKLLTVIEEMEANIVQLSKIDSETKRVPNIENLRKNFLIKNIRKYINSAYNKTN